LYFSYGISLRGYWTDKVLIWAWLVATIVFIITFFKRRIIKVYLGVLLLLTVLSSIPMGLPLMAFYGFMTASDRTFSYRIDFDHRVQELWKSPMAAGTVEIVKESGIVEQIIGHLPNEFEVDENFYSIWEAQSIRLQKDIKDSINVLLSFSKGQVSMRPEK
jgi:hypothetical protein